MNYILHILFCAVILKSARAERSIRNISMETKARLTQARPRITNEAREVQRIAPRAATNFRENSNTPNTDPRKQSLLHRCNIKLERAERSCRETRAEKSGHTARNRVKVTHFISSRDFYIGEAEKKRQFTPSAARSGNAILVRSPVENIRAVAREQRVYLARLILRCMECSLYILYAMAKSLPALSRCLIRFFSRLLPSDFSEELNFSGIREIDAFVCEGALNLIGNNDSIILWDNCHFKYSDVFFAVFFTTLNFHR